MTKKNTLTILSSIALLVVGALVLTPGANSSPILQSAATKSTTQGATPSDAPVAAPAAGKPNAQETTTPAVSDACRSALQSLNATLEASINLRSAARQGSLSVVKALNDDSASPAETLRAVYAMLQNLALQNLPGALDDMNTQTLAKQQKVVDTNCDPASGKDLADKQVAGEQTNLTAATQAYNKGLLEVLKYVNSGLDGLCQQLAAVPGMSATKDCASALKEKPENIPVADALEKAIPNGFRALATVLDQRPGLGTLWAKISKIDAISSLSDPTVVAANGTIRKNFDSLDTVLENATASIPAWLQTITKDVATNNLDATTTASTVLHDPTSNSAEGLSKQKVISTKLAKIDEVFRVWPSLSLTLQHLANSHFDDIAQNIDTLRSNTQAMHSVALQLSDSLAGDIGQFVTESVRLYYFTDVKRLMTALSSASHEIGGVSEAHQKAAQERTKLMQAELDLADAQAQVSASQNQVLNLQEEQRQQSALVQAAQLLESKSGFNLKRAQQQDTKAKDELSAAQDDLKASPDDPILQRKVATAQKRSDSTSAKEQQVDSAHKDAQDKATQAADNQEAKKGDANGIEAKIANERRALEAAQAQVQLQRRRTLLSADAESQAFALVRDNTPFFVSEPVGVDTDPVKRVLIFGFPDSASILLRGRPSDVEQVKQIIATFDTPAPQARLTLWTFQLNSVLGQGPAKPGMEKLNQSLEIIDEELGNTRALVNTTLGLLRQEITNVVRSSALDGCLPGADGTQCTLSEKEKAARIKFFAPSALKILAADAARITRDHLDVIPDPTATTTLGESLLMLSLSSDGNKQTVRDNFNKHLVEALKDLHLRIRKGHDLTQADLEDDFQLPVQDTESTSKKGRDKKDRGNTAKTGNGPRLLGVFPLTWRVLGIARAENAWPDQTSKSDQVSEADGKGKQTEILSSSQFEILYAYLQELRRRDADRMSQLAGELARYRRDTEEIESQQTNLLSTAAKNLGLSQDEVRKAIGTDPDRASLLKELDPSVQQMYTELGARKSIIVSLSNNALTQNKAATAKILRRYGYDKESAVLLTSDTLLFEELLRSASKKVESSYERARTAAADEMLKQFMIAVEDDIDKLFIQPMIYRLRQRLMNEARVGVGIVERESLLATNRLVARIDPRATAQLQVGQETDILGEAQQLAQLYFAVQSGGATAALGALNKNKREAPPEIYGVGTGNTFQVTPIFDPTGQALRFKFDYVSQTRITEPSGGADPQLPRVERHTVNTEVQLSNLETREISRFEANAKIGIPTRYSGGIPILKDIPYVRPWIPLAGWFVRRAGSNASVQQSVIFGQTTMYPSIADLVKLLATDNLLINGSQTDEKSLADKPPAH